MLFNTYLKCFSVSCKFRPIIIPWTSYVHANYTFVLEVLAHASNIHGPLCIMRQWLKRSHILDAWMSSNDYESLTLLILSVEFMPLHEKRIKAENFKVPEVFRTRNVFCDIFIHTFLVFRQSSKNFVFVSGIIKIFWTCPRNHRAVTSCSLCVVASLRSVALEISVRRINLQPWPVNQRHQPET